MHPWPGRGTAVEVYINSGLLTPSIEARNGRYYSPRRIPGQWPERPVGRGLGHRSRLHDRRDRDVKLR
jgi:hypothetical protein